MRTCQQPGASSLPSAPLPLWALATSWGCCLPSRCAESDAQHCKRSRAVNNLVGCQNLLMCNSLRHFRTHPQSHSGAANGYIAGQIFYDAFMVPLSPHLPKL